MAAIDAVYIQDDRVIVNLFGAHGPGGDFVNDKLQAIKVRAMAKAPVGAPRIGTSHNLGNLKFSHFRNGYIKRGPYQGTGSVINNAPYARYVHEGVPGKIKAPLPHGFRIPKSSWFYYTGGDPVLSGDSPSAFVRVRRDVDGQHANPWMQEAANHVLRGI